MNTYFLKKYIQNLSQTNIYNLAIKQNIILNKEELKQIQEYIHNNYQDYFNNKLSKEKILYDSKKILTPTNYQKFSKLYDEYKDKI